MQSKLNGADQEPVLGKNSVAATNMSQSKQLATRLFVLVSLVNIFVYSLVGFSLYQNHQQYMAQASVATQNLAQALEISVIGVLNKIDVALHSLARETERQLENNEINDRLLNQYMAEQHSQFPELEEIWVANAAGNVRWGTKLLPGKPVNISDREYFSRLLHSQGSRLVISKPVMGRITKEWSILACKRISNPDGSFAGVAFGSLRFVDYFSNLLLHIDIGQGGSITFRDQDLGLLVRYPQRSVREQVGSKQLSPKTLEMIRKDPKSGSYTAISGFDKIERTISYRKVDGYPFYVSVAQSTQDYLSPWKKEAAIALLLLVSFTLFIIIIAWMFYKRRMQETLTMQALERHSDDLEVINQQLLEEISERKKAEGALTETQALLNGVIDSTTDFIWSVESGSFGLCSFNKSIEQVFFKTRGIRLEIGMCPDVLFSKKEQIQTWHDFYRAALEKGSYTTEYVTVDGTMILELSFNPLTNGNKTFGISVFGKDITKSHQDLKKMRELSQRLHLATSSAKLGIWEWNVRDNIMIWNDQMFELYGTKPGSNPMDIDMWINRLHPDDKDATIAAYQGALNGDDVYDTTFRILLPNGDLKHIKANGLVIKGVDGSAERMLGINSDITATIQHEEEKLKLESQLHQAQKMESIGRLAGGIAHDFNNMLSVILGTANLSLLKVPEDGDLRRNLEMITQAAERSAKITRQLLAFSRKEVIEPKPINLNMLILESEKNLGRLIGEDVKLTFKPGSNLWTVMIDPSQVHQILINLSVNARDAMPEGGTLAIETLNVSINDDYSHHHLDAHPGDFVQLIVVDNGCGMERETIKHIFEPFFTTKEVGKGTGLGLATVYGIVTQNNGFINVYSEPGQGTVFKIYLPRLREEAEPEETVATAPLSGTGRILLVEDEEMLLWSTTRLLEEIGYTVIQADSPEKALAFCEQNEAFDLILTDVVMPGINGRDMVERIRAIKPGVKVLFMSGYTADLVARRGIVESGMHFISKPLDMKQLNDKIGQLLVS
ncbi:hybrid sensor histidine kinase/response regulator [Geobacter sp. SVR]|uniref:hybrid sensor histidine kinase/response regulator n=1 Tax=Geobacter sp. SVR TaxID=2495594 RepID=UPI00156400B8|nr:hybrid sensor histidine kinase/response regulator [Geobacter sp. SVR]